MVASLCKWVGGIAPARSTGKSFTGSPPEKMRSRTGKLVGSQLVVAARAITEIDRATRGREEEPSPFGCASN